MISRKGECDGTPVCHTRLNADWGDGDDDPGPEPPGFTYVLENIRPTHPRLFLNEEMLEKIHRNGLTPEQQEWLTALIDKVDRYPEPPELDEKLVAVMMSDEGGRRYGTESHPRVYEGNWGYCSAHAALAYLLTEERKHYDKAVKYLTTPPGFTR